MVGLAIAGAVGGGSNGICAALAVQGLGADLRESLFRKVQGFSSGDLDRLGTGPLITRLTKDVTQVQEATMTMMRILVRAPLLMAGSLIMAIATSPQLAFLPLVVMPVVLLIVLGVVRRATRMFTLVQQRIDELLEVIRARSVYAGHPGQRRAAFLG